MAVSINLSITQNSQSITANTSNVTVKLDVSWTYGSHNHYVSQTTGWVEINGEKYTFAKIFNPNKTTSGSHNLYTKTLNVPHNSDGTKTLQCSALYNTRVSSSTSVTDSASKTLTTIPRKSTLTVSNGTLGTAQTLKIAEKASSFNHKLYYTCGSSDKVYILGSAGSTSSTLSTSWTPPVSLAKYNTTGRSVSVKFTLQTYNGSTLIGSESYTKTFTIPSSVKPTVSYISVSDTMGYAGTYGGYIQGLSKFKVTVTPTLAYDSQIKSYKVTANGDTYSSSSFTTDVIKTSGASTNITATVTDARGYSSDTKTSSSIPVLAYSAPAISMFVATRCNSDGKTNDRGAYVKFTYKFGISGDTESTWSTKNTVKTFKIAYKKSGAPSYTTLVTTGTADSEKTTAAFEADVASSYEAQITITDNFKTTTKTIVIPTGFTLMSWNSSGKGFAIGKISEDNSFDVDMISRFRDNLYLDNGTNIYGTDTDGNPIQALTPNNSNGNLVLGYGGYDAKKGLTNIYGYDTLFYVSNIAEPGSYRPYRRRGDSFNVTVKTAGYVTNSGTDVSFYLPVSMPIVGSPIITVTSVDGFVLRQGGEYTHGSASSTYVKPTEYSVLHSYITGLFITAKFSNTTNVINNDSIGIYWSGKVTFS